MATPNFDQEFREIVELNWIRPAASDPRVKQLVRWIILGDPIEEFESGQDFYSLMKYVRDEHGLEEDEFNQMMEICETEVIKERRDG
jgi:hypothetical protein